MPSLLRLLYKQISTYWNAPPLLPLLLLCTAIIGARRPDAFYNPQFWAEDGMFFQANDTAHLSVLLVPYAGYLHLVPRLIALVASAFDPLFIPAIYVFCVLALVLYVAGRTQSQRMPFITNAGFALAVALVPDGLEVWLNITNVQSFLAAGLVLLLISKDPISPLAWVHDVTVLGLFGLSGPFSVLFCPLFVVRACTRQSSASVALALWATLIGAIQLWMLLHHPGPAESMTHFDWPYVFAVPGARIGGSLFAGILYPRLPGLFALNILGIIVLGLLVYLALFQRLLRPERFLVAGCCLILLVSVIYRQRAHLSGISLPGVGSRYFYAPQLIVLWLLLDLQSRGARFARSAAVLLSLFLLVNIGRLRESPLIDYNWASYVPKIREGKPVDIPINPAGWKIHMEKHRKR